jgi:hypothetical protein
MYYYFYNYKHNDCKEVYIEFNRGLYMCDGESYVDDFHKLDYYKQVHIFLEVLLKSRWENCETIIAHNLFHEDDIIFDVANRSIKFPEEPIEELEFDFDLSHSHVVIQES